MADATDLKIAAELRVDAAAQEAGDIRSVGQRFDELHAAAQLADPEYSDMAGAAFTFWDWWIDARNHDWQYYDGIRREDWPRLARHIADQLESSGEISDPALLLHFKRITESREPGLLARAWASLTRRAGPT